MSDSGTAETTSYPLGITPNRLRGFIALFFLLGVIYFTIFESDPPPSFAKVEVVIPDPPATFDEKTIVLPEFDESPFVDEEAQPSEGTEINVIEQQEDLELEPAPAPATAQAQTQEQQVEVDPEPAKEAAPSQQAALEVASAETPPSPSGSGFFVQVIALSSQAEAKEIASSLEELLKEPAYVQHVRRGGKDLYRVRIGPFGDLEGKANEVLNRLRDQGGKLAENAFVDEE